MTTIAQIRTATIAARAATGMPGIGTEAGKGGIRVVNATPGKGGRYTIDPLSDYLPAAQAIAVLRQIEAEKGWR